MTRTIMVLLALAFLPGCSYATTQVNQPPVAYIDSITPSEVTVGDTVNFAGHGTDVDGQVVAYQWRSDLDGVLSTAAVFQTSSLSVGDHEIFFMVQDDKEEWSAQVTGYVTVTEEVLTPVNVDSFTVSPVTIPLGGSATLSWSVSNATQVTINQGIGTVAASGSTTVAPGLTTTYTLAATGKRSTASASVTLTVGPPVHQLRIIADPNNSGYIRQSGAGSGGYVYVGDDQYNRDFQGFVTFDISSLPNTAVITKVSVDLSGYAIPNENPYPEMGCLGAYLQDYRSLDNTDYWSHPLSVPIGQWCSLEALSLPTDQPGMRNELQRRTGDNTFQFRLQFGEHRTDGDDKNDLLYWAPGSFPTLIIEYTL